MVALAIATRQGHVVYERFYEAFSEAEKAEVRGAFDQVAGPSSGVASTAAEEELVGRFRCVLRGPDGKGETAYAGCYCPCVSFAIGCWTASLLPLLRPFPVWLHVLLRDAAAPY